ncbi:hypothetical protein EST38_g13662 [Candolleomyces aberdarensis]|uniref:Uncharacterized protein n=1 Tax=Candolleomyces aberdarensis TaxID=2316362 RepID=A0A4Q2D0F4_9AGAR|nr:hypothetical protein EST38_g13662 [Candolleomyces aberdarensis]
MNIIVGLHYIDFPSPVMQMPPSLPINTTMPGPLANCALYFHLYLSPHLASTQLLLHHNCAQYYLSELPTQDSIMHIVNAVWELTVYLIMARLASIISPFTTVYCTNSNAPVINYVKST